ncbi:MAG: GYD domain-containing protein [Sterolibacteriaceae bacterium]|uniref:GYD domain-containing protein n=1 Tax=Candidatus Methylophosphatis roskildensis TaxID=2899263 RepID=A0A9D7E0B3_9PROT|nr:GYD domain-containing protein [Candidatus Methylophosphatis roskildensis]MBK7234133.1 GYD domain-containing protein [Sterolibacteriaceae bacterium]
MATFISLVSFTDQGIRNVKDSPDRFDAVRAMAEKMGVTVKGGYYTLGDYDMVLIVEGPEEAAMAMLMKVGSMGNVRLRSLRAFSPDEMRQILSKMP